MIMQITFYCTVSFSDRNADNLLLESAIPAKILLTAKLDSAYGLVQFWLSSEFFSSNYFQIGHC